MPVKSYLAHAEASRVPALAERIGALAGCTVMPAENRGALVIVTDTPSDGADERLRGELEAMEDLQSLTLVAAFRADDDLVSLGATHE